VAAYGGLDVVYNDAAIQYFGPMRATIKGPSGSSLAPLLYRINGGVLWGAKSSGRKGDVHAQLLRRKYEH
jgi:hypothetical protein